MLSCVQLFATPWTVAHQAPLYMEFSRQEWVAISFSRGSSQPRDWTHVSCITGRFLHLSHQGSPSEENSHRAIKISATAKLWFGNKCDWELCREKWVQVKERFFNMATRKNMYEIVPEDPLPSSSDGVS